MKTFTLKKVRAGAAKTFPVGWTIPYTYKAASIDIARQRAKLALKRDHPAEDILDWREVA